MTDTQEKKVRESSKIYVTEFLNGLSEWQVFHAFRSREKAYLDAGRDGRVIVCVEESSYQTLQSRVARLEAALNSLIDRVEEYAGGGCIEAYCFDQKLNQKLSLSDVVENAREALKEES